MADKAKFGQGYSREALPCEACEAMCLDAVDGTLSTPEQAAFDRHVAGCVMCAEQLGEARRGAAWMEMLKGHAPEPPAELLGKILARTSEVTQAQALSAPTYSAQAAAAGPSARRLGVLPARLSELGSRLAGMFRFDSAQLYFQPRMAMTAAMAFFSIALTMNLGGIHLSDLRPSVLQRTVADKSADAARTFQNLKVVYQVESRVSELRRDERSDDRDPGGPFSGSSSTKQSAPAQQMPTQPALSAPKEEKSQPKQAPPNGSSELIAPKRRLELVSSSERSGNDVTESNAQQTASIADALAMRKGA